MAITTTEAAESILQPIVENIYRAFDYRLEAEVKDRLATYASAELVDELYDRTHATLKLEGKDNTRAKAQQVGLTASNVLGGMDHFTCDVELP